MNPELTDALDGSSVAAMVHAGEHRFPLSDEVEAVPAAQLLTDGFAAPSHPWNSGP